MKRVQRDPKYILFIGWFDHFYHPACIAKRPDHQNCQTVCRRWSNENCTTSICWNDWQNILLSWFGRKIIIGETAQENERQRNEYWPGSVICLSVCRYIEVRYLAEAFFSGSYTCWITKNINLVDLKKVSTFLVLELSKIHDNFFYKIKPKCIVKMLFITVLLNLEIYIFWMFKTINKIFDFKRTGPYNSWLAHLMKCNHNIQYCSVHNWMFGDLCHL